MVLAYAAVLLAVTTPAGGQEAAASPVVGAVYPHDRAVSPITEAVAARIRAIAARNRGMYDDRFSKIGASATVNRNFLRCFAGEHVRLGEHGRLAPAIAHFNGTTHPSFRRRSLSAEVGWHAGRAVWGGERSPLAREIRDHDPRFAVVMYGTNDLELNRPALYASLMHRLTKMLIVRGVVPILSTIMPRDDDPAADRYVTLYNAVVRAVAQHQRIPLFDFHRALTQLPDHGLARDGVHPDVQFEDGDPRGCDFTEGGLRHGYNRRNLLAMRALDAAWRALEGTIELEASAPRPVGDGTFSQPIEAELPFATVGDTSRAAPSARDDYPGCGDQHEAGPEVVYGLHLDEPARIYALATSTHRVDVDVHVIDAEGECLARADEGLEVELPAGDHRVVVDTYGDDDDLAGRYTLAIARTDLPSDRD